jgi:integrase
MSKVGLLSKAEVRRLVDCASGPAIRVMLLVANTGVRCEGLLTLTWPDIDFARRVLTFPLLPAGTPHRVDVSRRAIKIFREMPVKGNDRVFDRAKYSLPELRAELDRASRRAEVAPISFRDLQFAWAHGALAGGADCHVVQCVLGVSDGTMMRRLGIDMSVDTTAVAPAIPRYRRALPDNVIPFRPPGVRTPTSEP